MTVREWLSATWAEWAPSWSRGHFEVGDLLIMSRAELARIAREQRDGGIWFERQNPGKARIHEDDEAGGDRSTGAEVIELRTGIGHEAPAAKRHRPVSFGDLPILIVRRTKMAQREINAFELGRESVALLHR